MACCNDSAVHWWIRIAYPPYWYFMPTSKQLAIWDCVAVFGKMVFWWTTGPNFFKRVRARKLIVVTFEKACMTLMTSRCVWLATCDHVQGNHRVRLKLWIRSALVAYQELTNISVRSVFLIKKVLAPNSWMIMSQKLCWQWSCRLELRR